MRRAARKTQPGSSIGPPSLPHIESQLPTLAGDVPDESADDEILSPSKPVNVVPIMRSNACQASLRASRLRDRLRLGRLGVGSQAARLRRMKPRPARPKPMIVSVAGSAARPASA